MGRRYIAFHWLVATVVAAASGGSRCALADPPGNADWRVVFADEFSGSTLDTVKWAPQYEWGRTHNHAAYMLDQNIEFQGDGNLSLVGRRQSTNGKPFSSGVISSHGTFRITEGYIEARVKMPTTRGSWPAFWMLRGGWPPEIDIMENPLFVDSTTTDQYAVNNFWPGTGPPSDFQWIDTNIDLSNEFHNYGLQLDSSGLRFFFDGQQVKFSNYKPEFQDMYLIFNYAIGGWPVPGSSDSNPLPPSTDDWPARFADQVQAEWIRVWQTAPATDTSTWTIASGGSASWDTAANWDGVVPNFEGHQVVLPTSGRGGMELRWNNSRTVGSILLNGTTQYTLGQAGGNVESIMFADESDGWSELWSDEGDGGHTVNARLDLWSNLSARNNTPDPITLNGDIVGQLRTVGRQRLGGALQLSGSGEFIINGDGTYQADTVLTEGVTATLNGQLYADGFQHGSARVIVEQGSTLVVSSLDNALGQLSNDASRLLVNNGTIRLTQSDTVLRGVEIGPDGATLDIAEQAVVTFSGSDAHFDQATAGILTLAGAGEGHLDKQLDGNGGVAKTGTGRWTLAQSNSYDGETQVDEGLLLVNGSTGAGDTYVAADGVLGGTGDVLGDLSVVGALSPGDEIGTLSVLGHYTQQDGAVLNLQIGGTDEGMFDVLDVTGTASLDGSLNISLENGFMPAAGDLFPILFASDVTGQLDLSGDSLGFSLLTTTEGLSLQFASTATPGDYNGDNEVTAADYTAWRDTFGTEVTPGTGADGNGDGLVNAADYTLWRNRMLGQAAGTAESTAVPEPTALALLLIAMTLSTGRVARRLAR
jgi:autotransporter-associated beta strand protein